MEQPNATGDGDAPLTPRMWAMVVLTGVAAGLFGDLMMYVLFNIEHLAFRYSTGDLISAVGRSSDARRVIVLAIAGVFGGVAWFLLRRFTKDEKSDVDDVLWAGDAKLSFRRSFGTSLISEVVVGMGASIGREAAPKLMGAASGSVFAAWGKLTPGQRRLLVACGGGAGLAAVYNVPLGGALFTAEILYGSMALPAVMPALVCCAVATITAWIYLPAHATYADIPSYHPNTSLIVSSLLMGVLIGLVAAGLIRLIGWTSHTAARGKRLLVAPLIGFTILGLIGIAYPQLFGNGKDMAHFALLGQGTFWLLFALFALKPLVTCLCLKSGASGGLFTPMMSTGAVFGGCLGVAWSHFWPGSPVGAFAMVGAAAMIGASMQAPLTGLALMLELTHSGFQMMVPMAAATVLATAIARYLDGYSIYSARLPAGIGAASPAAEVG